MTRIAKWFAVVTLLAGSALANVELTAPDGQALAMFGYSISVNGNTMAISTGNYYENGQCCRGIVYVYGKNASHSWNPPVLLAELTASDGSVFNSVAISGNTIVAGSLGATVNGVQYQGCAFVFVAGAQGWQNAHETARLTSSDGYAGNVFGTSVAIDKATIVVGAPGAGTIGQGEVYVFTQPSTGWITATETARLTASNGQTSDYLGASVSVNGVVVAAGAPDVIDHNGYPDNWVGAVYVFQEKLGGWQTMTETAELTAGQPILREQLGFSVAIEGGTVVAGAPSMHTLGVNAHGGRVLVYLETSNGWKSTTTPSAVLTCTEVNPEGFGQSVAINPKLILVGDPFALTFIKNDGAAFAFKKPSTGWANATQSQKFIFVVPGQWHTGSSVAASFNTTAFIGAPYTLINGNQFQGAVFEAPVK
jgi:hypothetical protein